MTESRLVHEVLWFADESELCAAALPFLRDGIAAGELVCAVTGHSDVLRRALGADADRVAFMDAGEWFTRPGHTFGAYQRFIDESLAQPGASARVLAEAVWADRSRPELVEWQRFESAINSAFADAPLHVTCCYDRRRTPADVQTGAAQTHPSVHGDDRQANPAYVPPETFIDRLERDTVLPAPPPSAATMTVNGNLSDLREFVRAAAAPTSVPADRVHDAVLVANELATNLLRHSGAYGELLTWASDGRLVCELRDPTGNRPPALAGYTRPDPQQANGCGLPLVRQLADLVNITHDDHGSTVRVTFTTL